VLASAPRTIRLNFDEAVVPRYARVVVTGARNSDLAGPPVVADSVVTVPVRSAPRGSYTVRWRMVASDDGHATEGAYSYGVRVKPQPPAPASGLDVPMAPQLLAWLQFLGIVLAGGMLTFRALIWAPAARDLAGGAPDATTAIGVAVIGAVVGLHAGLLAFLTGAYPIVGGGLSNFVNTEITPIRVGTHLGVAWTVMSFAWLGVLMLLVAAWATPARRERLLAWAGGLTLSMAIWLSWSSHPASRGDLALIADYVHLVAGALWVGGLVAVVLVAFALRALDSPAREALSRRSILRFSRLALPTVVVVALAGLYLALRQLPAPSALVSTGYGLTLLVKSAIALGAIALGAYHRRFVVPRLADGAPVAAVRRTLTLELGVLLAVLVLAAILSQSAPPG
jgi:copper transport protein